MGPRELDPKVTVWNMYNTPWLLIYSNCTIHVSTFNAYHYICYYTYLNTIEGGHTDVEEYAIEHREGEESQDVVEHH